MLEIVRISHCGRACYLEIKLLFLHFFFLLLGQLTPGGEILLALLQHRGYGRHQRAEEGVAGDTDTSQEPDLGQKYYQEIFSKIC